MKKAVLTMGLPGSGKSYILNKEYDLSEYTLVDPDICKKSIPGYDPKNPGAVHEQSKLMAEAEKSRAIAFGENIIIDGTGTNVEKMYRRIKDMQSAGYEVTLLYVKVSITTAIKRNAARERSVPESLIREKYETISDAFEICSAIADVVKVVAND